LQHESPQLAHGCPDPATLYGSAYSGRPLRDRDWFDFHRRPTEKEKAHSQGFRTMLWRCRIVFRHSRRLAEKVLDGSISLHKAFIEARPPQLPRQGPQKEKSDSVLINASPQSWSRKSGQDDKWSFCLTAGTLCAANQERQ